jgi:hypothetical protein
VILRKQAGRKPASARRCSIRAIFKVMSLAETGSGRDDPFAPRN